MRFQMTQLTIETVTGAGQCRAVGTAQEHRQLIRVQTNHAIPGVGLWRKDQVLVLESPRYAHHRIDCEIKSKSWRRSGLIEYIGPLTPIQG